MAYMKHALLGVGLIITAELIYGGFQGQKTRNAVSNAKEKLTTIGVSPNQIKQAEENIGKLDILDNALGNYGPHSKAKAWDSTATYLEQQAHINKARIRNIDVGKLSASITQKIIPKVIF